MKDDARPKPDIQTPPMWWRRDRWRYAAGCFLLGAAYTSLAMLYGFELRLGGHDVSLVAGGMLELSFAVLGYLLGVTREARRGERLAAKEVEEQLRNLADLRARLAQTEKLASLGQLSGALAHEVRNPLAIIRSMVQNLSEELPDDADAARASCGDILEEVDRLARVTSTLVDFARPLTPRRQEVVMDELGRRVQLLADSWLRGSEVGLVVRGPSDVSVHGDPDLLCQVLLGLVSNAVDASPAGGQVGLSWHREDGQGLEIRVQDQGAGVPAELRERVFEPFFTTRPDGHGLGLAVARQIVDAHGGRLSVLAGEPGATFQLWLPDREGLPA